MSLSLPGFLANTEAGKKSVWLKKGQKSTFKQFLESIGV